MRLHLYTTHETLAELYADEHQVMMRELNLFAQVESRLEQQMFVIECDYEDWIMWCLKRPSWATKFKAGR